MPVQTDYRALALRAVALLRELETESNPEEGAICPECGTHFSNRLGMQPHAPACELAAILALADAMKDA